MKQLTRKADNELLQKLEALLKQHHQEIDDLLSTYLTLFDDEKRRKKMEMTVLYCIICVLVGAAAGVGIGYLIWGKTKEISYFPPETKKTAPKSQPKPEQNAELPSKEDALKALELLECLYEINHID